MNGGEVTTGELWRQGQEIKGLVKELDSKLDITHDTVTRHDGTLTRHEGDIADIRAELKSKRVTTGTIAGVVATIITVAGQIIDHLH